MKKENIYIDLSKCSEKERKHIFSLLPKDEITAQIYYMIRNMNWEVLKAFSHLFFNENSAWQLCSNRSTETIYKTELTYPEFIKLFEEPKLPSELLKEYFKNTPKEQVLQDWESTAYLDNTNNPKIRELFEGETCPKCRTKDFENCHSIRCPMRDENLFERGVENNGWIKIEKREDLPRQRDEYWFVSKLEKDKIVKAYFNPYSVLDGNKEHYVKLYSHYQPIVKPKLPKF